MQVYYQLKPVMKRLRDAGPPQDQICMWKPTPYFNPRFAQGLPPRTSDLMLVAILVCNGSQPERECRHQENSSSQILA